MKLYLTLDNEKGNKIERVIAVQDALNIEGIDEIVYSMCNSMIEAGTWNEDSIDGLSGKEEQKALKVINTDWIPLDRNTDTLVNVIENK